MNESFENNEKAILESLIKLAQEADADEDKAEDNWGKIDETLSNMKILENSLIVKWSNEYVSKYLTDKAGESGLLDLSASVLEIGGKDVISEEGAVALVDLLDYQNEDNPYPRFRAACALANSGNLSDKVKNVLLEFANDEDEGVVDIAKKYLNQ